MQLQVSGVQGEDSDELTIDDPELLMEMMDMREAVDASDSEDDLRDLQKANDTQLKSCVSALSEAFSRGDVKAAVQGTQRLTYLYKVRDEIIKKL